MTAEPSWPVVWADLPNPDPAGPPGWVVQVERDRFHHVVDRHVADPAEPWDGWWPADVVRRVRAGLRDLGPIAAAGLPLLRRALSEAAGRPLAVEYRRVRVGDRQGARGEACRTLVLHPGAVAVVASVPGGHRLATCYFPRVRRVPPGRRWRAVCEKLVNRMCPRSPDGGWIVPPRAHVVNVPDARPPAVDFDIRFYTPASWGFSDGGWGGPDGPADWVPPPTSPPITRPTPGPTEGPAMPDHAPVDRTGCLGDLRAALASPGLAAAEPGEAATLAIAVGRCRVFGVRPPPDLDRPLTPELAAAAAAGLATYADEIRHESDALGERWDAAAHWLEAEDAVLGVLEGVEALWAGYLAVDEAEAALTATGAWPTPLSDPLAALGRAVDAAWDAALAQAELLAVAAGTHWLANHRARLAPEFADTPPWWLDGRLEAIAARQLGHPPAEPSRPSRPEWAGEYAPALAAAPPAAGGPARRLVWRRPGTGRQAWLDLPPAGTGTPDDPVVLVFLGADEDLDAAADGPVELAGVAAVARAGRATFRRGDLDLGDPVLVVGPARERWGFAGQREP